MRFALINDTHIGARQDNLVIMKNQLAFFEDQFIPYVRDKSNRIDAIIHAGDMFDKRTQTNHQTLERFKSRVFDPLRDSLIPVYWILGNHDSYYKTSLTVNASGLLDGYNFNVISEPTEYPMGGGFLMVPWVCPENFDATFKLVKSTKARWCVGHLELSGIDLGRGIKSTGGISTDEFNKFDRVISGHYHHRSQKNNILYCGTQYEMTWADYGDQKGFHVLDTDSGEIEFIKNPRKIFHVLKYPEVIEDKSVLEDSFVKVMVEDVDSKSKLEKYLTEIETCNPFDLKIIEREDVINSESVDDQIQDAKSTIQMLLDSIPEYCAQSNDAVLSLVESTIKRVYESARESFEV